MQQPHDLYERVDKLEVRVSEHDSILSNLRLMIREELKPIIDTQNHHTKLLGEHTKLLSHHTKLLGEHSALLSQHTKLLQDIKKLLPDNHLVRDDPDI